MRWLSIVALGWILGSASPVHGQERGRVPRVEPRPDAEPNAVLEWTTPEGQEYWYRLPKPKRGATPALVVMLHGTGLDHGWAFWNYPIADGGFRPDDIVVSPDGLTPGNGETFNFAQNSTDEEQIVGLIETFRSRFEIGNVYLYGHSQGAFFAYWFAGERPELVDGIVAHAGNALGNVRHPKLAKEKVAIGILHARSDQVVSVVCAEESHELYEAEGYRRLRCDIIEDIRPEAGHWPLPVHVAELFEWLDSVCTNDAGQAMRVVTRALFSDEVDLAVAVRAAREGHELLRRERGDAKAALAARLELLDQALDAAAAAVWADLEAALAANDGGKRPGAFAADVRWARRVLAEHEGFEDAAKPVSSLAKKHDKRLAKLSKVKDPDSKKYAGALLAALEESWFAREWDDVHARATRRVAAGWQPVEGLAAELAALAESHGSAPSAAIQDAARRALVAFAEAHPEVLSAE